MVRYRMPPSVHVVRAGVTCGLLPNCCGRVSVDAFFWVGWHVWVGFAEWGWGLVGRNKVFVVGMDETKKT